MSDEIAIKVRNVSKNFVLPHEKVSSVKSLFTGITRRHRGETKETQHALKDISFEIKKGEFFGIVGRNGSGKSTLLKILAGIYQPTSGTVQAQGKLVPFIELGVGFNPELTGRENVYLNGAMLGFSETEVDAMYDEIVEFAELERFMDQKLKNYSSGMQVRLAFSMATRSEADILLIDEVLAVGDADFQRKCYDYFKNLKKLRKTVVFVSHDMGAIREFCDRAALIEQNQIELIGNTIKVSEQYSELFLKHDGDNNLNKLNNEQRSGSGAARITKVELNRETFTDKDETVRMKVRLERRGATSQLMNGFAVKNSEGQFINGSHTWKVTEDLGIAEGSFGEVVWDLPNLYEDGLYTIDVHAYGSNHEIYDNLTDAITFRVKRPQRSGCLITPSVKVEINGGAPYSVV
jgi:ABC-2 type transport system ATP-binding protein